MKRNKPKKETPEELKNLLHRILVEHLNDRTPKERFSRRALEQNEIEARNFLASKDLDAILPLLEEVRAENWVEELIHPSELLEKLGYNEFPGALYPTTYKPGLSNGE